jgi:type II secretion system protein G
MSKRGFTLIELLVVISIISFLSSIVLANLTSARAKARDAKRLQDLTQIRTALAMYYLDNGNYPSTGGGWQSFCPGYNPGGIYGLTGASGYIPNLAPTYISILPTDPKPIGTYNCYLYRSVDGSEYMFLVYGTVEGNVPVSLQRPAAPAEKDYAVYTPGAILY